MNTEWFFYVCYLNILSFDALESISWSPKDVSLKWGLWNTLSTDKWTGPNVTTECMLSLSFWKECIKGILFMALKEMLRLDIHYCFFSSKWKVKLFCVDDNLPTNLEIDPLLISLFSIYLEHHAYFPFHSQRKWTITSGHLSRGTNHCTKTDTNK